MSNKNLEYQHCIFILSMNIVTVHARVFFPCHLSFYSLPLLFFHRVSIWEPILKFIFGGQFKQNLKTITASFQFSVLSWDQPEIIG